MFNDGRTAVYKQLLGDHRKIIDKYKSVEKDLAFAKSKCLSSRVTFVSTMSCLGSNLFLRAAEAKKQMDKVLKELEAVKGKFRIVFRIELRVCISVY